MCLQLIHILALSPQVMVYSIHGYLLSTYSCGIGVVLSAMGSGWSRLYCQPSSRAQLLELWYGVLEALYVSLARVIWSSHADLSGSGPHKLISLCQDLIHRHSPLVAVSCSTLIISLSLASRASLSSPFKSLLRWSPLFSRSVESGFSMVWSQGSAEYTASPFPEHNCWSCSTGF